MELLFISPHIFTLFSSSSSSSRYSIRVSAHFRRRRTNHLRKKLIEQQVRLQNPILSNPHTNAQLDVTNPIEPSPSPSLSTKETETEMELEMVMGKPNSNLVNYYSYYSSLGFITGKPKIYKVGVSVFCSFLLFIAFNSFFTKRKKKIQQQEYSSLEKEMLTRKMKARMMANQKSIKGSVELIQEPHPQPQMLMFKESPQLDKEELINTIAKDKIQQITPEIQNKEQSIIDNQPDGKDPQTDVSTDIPQPVGLKFRIITSVKEAREYLHNKDKKQEQPEINSLHQLPVPKRDSNSVVGEDGDASLINNTVSNHQCVKGGAGDLGRANRDKWIQDNFHEFEPLVDKIRGGFRNNYMVAREKVKQDINLVSELQRDENESEFEWMKDEKLREIVFQVRENELMGRDPFYLMDTQDKALFFKGLEEKVEKENEKLGHLHEYLHSKIENLDYGADGISLYDSPEKIIPRWKGPPPETTMSQEFLDDYLDQRKALFAETLGNLDLDSQIFLQSSNENEQVESNKQTKVVNKNLKSSQTVIEGSDGSIKPGKKSGKEFWQHTKKWSRGFIDSYNAENDPETKADMKDIGKDLDRWITEREIQDAADIMDKVPDKGKKFIAERINKLKREMELFGPQAVVSKYSEYGDEEEIDYYWWLDLPFLLCIELYIDGDEDERIGFYSLEMASDLELDPKPHHIIAFEDAGDCKNLCYVIQTHMEMLGNGNAFVVPQLPKDTYQEAKANGFNVTVIRKGELKLDVDQTLEEVEEKIVEIGSKMYHDQIMKSRNVNVDSVMKGVFGLKKTTSRGRLKWPTK